MLSARERVEEVALDGADQPQTAEHERAIELHHAGAGLDLGQRAFAVMDAADTDQRKGAFDPHIGFRQHARRELEQWRSGKAAGLMRGVTILEPGRRQHRRVADDHAVDAVPACRANHVVKLVEREVGRDLDQHRRRPGFAADAGARLHHARKELVECPAALQVAQARRVRRGDVAGEIARHRREHLDLAHVVGDPIGRILVGADIDADDAALRRAGREPAQHGVGAFAVEAQAIDHAFVGRQAEQARPRIARLRQRRDGPDLHEAEAEPKQRGRHPAMLVETGRHSHRIAEVEAERPHCQPRIVLGGRRQRCKLERIDRKPMAVLGSEQPHQRARQGIEQIDHGSSSGKTWRPWAPSGSGLTQRTPTIGSAPERCGEKAPPRPRPPRHARPRPAAATAPRPPTPRALEMPRRGLLDLGRPREMDVAVALVDADAAEGPHLLGGAPVRAVADLVDRRRHALPRCDSRRASRPRRRRTALSKPRAGTTPAGQRMAVLRNSRAPRHPEDAPLGSVILSPGVASRRHARLVFLGMEENPATVPRISVQESDAMLTHLQVWTALDRLAQRAGLSPSGLAKKAGLDPTTFNKSKRITPEGRARWPSTESVAKSLAATGTSMETFVQLIDDTARPPAQGIPLTGFAQAGVGGYFDDAGFPVGKGWDEVAFPAIADENAYALRIYGDSMEPAYRDGAVIVVSPAATIRKGDRIVL